MINFFSSIFKNRSRSRLNILLVILIGLSLAGCSHFSSNTFKANSDLIRGNYDQAISTLKPLAEKENDDQLVYLLDYGMALHLAGRYDESIRAFLKADQIAAIQDYTSLSREAGSILLNEGMVQYKGDDFEKVFIHIYLALNFLMKQDLDGALVETRKTNEILTKFRNDAKKSYDLNPFAFYLGGVIWEADHKWDDAYIAYSDSYKGIGDKLILKKDLLRLSKWTSREGAFETWSKKFQDVPFESTKNLKEGEFVFIYQQGWGPVKRANPNFPRIPKLYPQSSEGLRANLILKDTKGKEIFLKTERFYDLSEAAIKTLDDQYATLIAKRAAGIVTKYVVADQIAKKNEGLGVLAWIGMNLVDQADLRQWSNLPESFQIARVKLAPGEYEISAQSLNYKGDPLPEQMKPVKVKIRAGKTEFLTWRSFK